MGEEHLKIFKERLEKLLSEEYEQILKKVEQIIGALNNENAALKAEIERLKAA